MAASIIRERKPKGSRVKNAAAEDEKAAAASCGVVAACELRANGGIGGLGKKKDGKDSKDKDKISAVKKVRGFHLLK